MKPPTLDKMEVERTEEKLKDLVENEEKALDRRSGQRGMCGGEFFWSRHRITRRYVGWCMASICLSHCGVKCPIDPGHGCVPYPMRAHSLFFHPWQYRTNALPKSFKSLGLHWPPLALRIWMVAKYWISHES